MALWGGRPVPVYSAIDGDRFVISRDALESAYTARSRVLLLNTPWNPVGTVFRREELAARLALAAEPDLSVISDEIYESLVYDGRRHVSPAVLPEARQRTVVVN